MLKAIEMANTGNLSQEKSHLHRDAKNCKKILSGSLRRPTSAPRPANARVVKSAKELNGNGEVAFCGVSRNTSLSPSQKLMAMKKSVLTFASKEKRVNSAKKVKRSLSSPAVTHCEAKKQNLKAIDPNDENNSPPSKKSWSMSGKVMNIIQKLNPMKLKSFFSKSVQSVRVSDVVQVEPAEVVKHQYSRANFPKWQKKEIMQGVKRNPQVELNRILACEEKWTKETQHERGQDRLRLFEDRYFSKKWACLHGTFQGFQNTCYYSSSGELVERAYRDSPVELGQEMHSFDEVVYPYSYPKYMKYIKNNECDMDERSSRIMRSGLRNKNKNVANRSKCLCDFHSSVY